MVQAPTSLYRYPWLDLDPQKIVALTSSLIGAGVTYGLGSKIVPISLQAPQLQRAKVDCSGFVDWCCWHAGATEVPDGSVSEHDWVKAQGFKPCDLGDVANKDGAVRIAFLSPEDGGGVGHVMLIVDGRTCESHGGVGVDRRVWLSKPFMQKCSAYVLTPPTALRGDAS